jgi:hypothetical protein
MFSACLSIQEKHNLSEENKTSSPGIGKRTSIVGKTVFSGAYINQDNLSNIIGININVV